MRRDAQAPSHPAGLSWKGCLMSANTGSGLSAHGKLWYDDRWYRIAYINDLRRKQRGR
jgi:hypothetical protein